jgi:hypothetical protein
MQHRGAGQSVRLLDLSRQEPWRQLQGPAQAPAGASAETASDDRRAARVSRDARASDRHHEAKEQRMIDPAFAAMLSRIKPRRYEVIENVPAEGLRRPFEIGQRFFQFLGCDYGCRADDEAVSGEEHSVVTEQADGMGAFVTIPTRALRELGQDEK